MLTNMVMGETTICIRSKAIQIYFWVAFLRICRFIFLRSAGVCLSVSRREAALSGYVRTAQLCVSFSSLYWPNPSVWRCIEAMLICCRRSGEGIAKSKIYWETFFIARVTQEFEFFYAPERGKHEINKLMWMDGVEGGTSVCASTAR